MNRSEMIEGIMRHAGISKANVARFYEGLAELTRKQLQREKEFVLPGLGVLRVRHRAARTARNPKTREVISVPARLVVRFRAYKSLSELLNGPRAKGASPQPPEPTGQLPLEGRKEP